MAVSKIPVSLPSKFDGDKDFPLWLRSFEVCATANNWTEEQKLLFLPTLLEGKAFEIFAENDPAISFPDLCATLRSSFSPPERKRLLMTEFFGRCQRTEETSEDYMRTLKRLLSRAMPQLPENSRDAFVLEQFLRGLDNSVREKVAQADPHDVVQAVSVATRCEALNEIKASTANPERAQVSTVRTSSPQRPGISNQPSNEVLSSLLNNLTDQIERMKVTLEDMKRNRNYTPEQQRNRSGQKYYGPRGGSPSRDRGGGFRKSEIDDASHEGNLYARGAFPVRERSDSPRRGRRYPNQDVRFSSRTTDGRPICFQCGRPGHVRATCPQKHHLN